MAICNFDNKEINCKVFYFGGALVGKTESLRALYRKTSSQIQSGLFELEAETAINPLFDFLPLKLGIINGYHVRIHAFTLPGDLYPDVIDIMLKGIDGFVFVVDSTIDALLPNIDALQTLHQRLHDCGYVVEDLPHVFQYNKRDLKNIIDVDILHDTFNPRNCPDQQTIASRGIGVVEGLQQLAQVIVTKMLNKR